MIKTNSMTSRPRHSCAIVRLLVIILVVGLLKIVCAQKEQAQPKKNIAETVQDPNEHHQVTFTTNSSSIEHYYSPSPHVSNSEAIPSAILENSGNDVNKYLNKFKNKELEHPSNEKLSQGHIREERETVQKENIHQWHSNGLDKRKIEEMSRNKHHFLGEDEKHHHDSEEVTDWWGSGARTRHRRARDDGTCDLEIKCRGDVEQRRTGAGMTPGPGGAMTVRLPIRGQRGSSGDKGEKGEPGRPGLAFVAKGDSNDGRDTRPKIAFFVGLAKNMGPLTKNSDVIFDRVVTNVGGAYDETSGQLIAPVDGTYQINVAVSAQGKQKAAVMILHNGKMVSTVWAESIPSWSTSSTTLILSLRTQDRVGLLALHQASYLHGYMYTSFSGLLLFED